MSKQFEIFKAGTRTSADGTVWHISAADVARAAAVYDPAKHEAPIVIGHPKMDAPAYGWVPALSAASGSLSAEFAQMDADFAEAVAAGRYKKVSASFWPPGHPNNPVPDSYYLRHVGFLGAHAPAVKGLRPIEFAANEAGIVEFSEAAHEHTASVLRSLRDWLLAKFGQADADAAIPGWQIESIKEVARYHDAPIEQAAFAEAHPHPGPLPEGEGVLPTPSEDQPHEPKETDMSQETAAALAAATARADAAEAEVKRLQAEQEQSLLAAGHKANADFAESLAADGKLKPADKALVAQLLNFAEHPQHVTPEFGEGDAVQSLAEGLRGVLRALPPAMEFVETATAAKAAAGTPAAVADFAEADADTVAHHQRAQALMAKEGIGYEEAARRTAI